MDGGGGFLRGRRGMMCGWCGGCVVGCGDGG